MEIQIKTIWGDIVQRIDIDTKRKVLLMHCHNNVLYCSEGTGKVKVYNLGDEWSIIAFLIVMTSSSSSGCHLPPVSKSSKTTDWRSLIGLQNPCFILFVRHPAFSWLDSLGRATRIPSIPHSSISVPAAVERALPRIIVRLPICISECCLWQSFWPWVHLNISWVPPEVDGQLLFSARNCVSWNLFLQPVSLLAWNCFVILCFFSEKVQIVMPCLCETQAVCSSSSCNKSHRLSISWASLGCWHGHCFPSSSF